MGVLSTFTDRSSASHRSPKATQSLRPLRRGPVVRVPPQHAHATRMPLAFRGAHTGQPGHHNRASRLHLSRGRKRVWLSVPFAKCILVQPRTLIQQCHWHQQQRMGCTRFACAVQQSTHLQARRHLPHSVQFPTLLQTWIVLPRPISSARTPPCPFCQSLDGFKASRHPLRKRTRQLPGHPCHSLLLVRVKTVEDVHGQRKSGPLDSHL